MGVKFSGWTWWVCLGQRRRSEQTSLGCFVTGTPEWQLRPFPSLRSLMPASRLVGKSTPAL